MGRPPLDRDALLQRLLQLDLSLPKAELARRLGIGITTFKTLLGLWAASGRIAYRKMRPAAIVAKPQDSFRLPAGYQPATSLKPIISATIALSDSERAPTRERAQRSGLLAQEAETVPVQPSVEQGPGRAQPGQKQVVQSGEEPEREFELDDGRRVRGPYIWNHARRLTQNEVKRILEAWQNKPFRAPLIDGLAHALRRSYLTRWAQAHGRPEMACPYFKWENQPPPRPGKNGKTKPPRRTGNRALFAKAAERWAEAIAHRGMALNDFMDAVEDLCPRQMKFPTLQMVAGALGEKAKEWAHPSERGNGIQAWTDKKGQEWVNVEGVGPVPIY
jgi:hypothetical protein